MKDGYVTLKLAGFVGEIYGLCQVHGVPIGSQKRLVGSFGSNSALEVGDQPTDHNGASTRFWGDPSMQ